MENLLKYLESNEVLSIKEVIELKKEINIDFADQPNKFRIKVLYKAICKKILPHLYGLRDNDSKYICQNIMEHYLFNKKDIFSKSLLEEILILDLDYLELKKTIYNWVTENNNYPIEPWKLDEFLKNYSTNYYQKYKKYEEFENIKASSLEMERELQEEKERKRLEKEKKKQEVKDNLKKSLKSGADKLKNYKEKVISDIEKIKEHKVKEDKEKQEYLPDLLASSKDDDIDEEYTPKRVATKLVDNFIIGEISPSVSSTTAVMEIEETEEVSNPDDFQVDTTLGDIEFQLENKAEVSTPIEFITEEETSMITTSTDFTDTNVDNTSKAKSRSKLSTEKKLTAITIGLYIALLAIPKQQYVAPITEAVVLDLNISDYDTLGNDLSVIVKNVIAHRNPEIPLDFRYRFINKAKLSEYLQTRNSLLAEEPYMSIIINTAKSHDLNPNILFALAGQEQGFVPKDNRYASKIINNPYNVFTSWKKYNTDLEDATNIACRTIKNLVKERPLGENPFKWINRKYAQDKNWWKGINSLFVKLEGLQN